MTHHQTEEVLEALAQHQLVVFVGARGTGKTCLLASVRATLISRGVTVLSLDAADARSASDLLTPIAERLQCDQDRLTATMMSESLRLRVLIDSCDALHEKSWFPAVQDEWRGLLGETAARGRVAFLLCGRPLFRRVAEGRGSPLVGIGQFLPSRPLTTQEIQHSLRADSEVAEKAHVKTGGHPQLTRRLLDAMDRDVAKLQALYAQFARSQRRFLLQLIDDHGAAARVVLADLLDGRRDALVAESAVVARHFGGAGVVASDTLEDLAASGLIERVDGCCRLAAEILRTDRDLRVHLAAPAFAVVEDPSPEYAEAAATLFRAENRLRRFVGSALGQLEEAWWPSRFPTTVVREVEQRRRSEAESVVSPAEQMHPIAYLTLGELFDSMLSEANWEQVFRVRLAMSRDAFIQIAAVLTAVRNKVAHHRPVSKADLEVLNLNLGRLPQP